MSASGITIPTFSQQGALKESLGMALLEWLIAGCACVTCLYTYDMYRDSEASLFITIPDYGYCLRFTASRGVVMINKLGEATAGIYHSSALHDFISSYTYDGPIENQNKSASTPRAISFGDSYGMIYISSEARTWICYTYIYANATCNLIALSSKQSVSFSFPNNSQSVIASNTYCFLYAAWGIQSVDVTFNSSAVTASDTMYYKSNMEYKEVPFGKSNYTDSFPLELIYTPNSSDISQRFDAELSAFNITFQGEINYADAIVEGQFSSTSDISYLYYNSSYHSYLGIILGCVFGTVFLVCVACVAYFCIKRRRKTATIYDYRTVPTEEANNKIKEYTGAQADSGFQNPMLIHAEPPSTGRL